MTARRQLRIGNRRLGRDRAPIDATPAPPIGETLQLARERKGVDLFRAERDTKIRLRYLSALEDSDYDEQPAPVYTKGFLRNYAIYLGLDPEEVLDRWHDEMEAMRTATRVAVAPPPMPIAEPGGRRLTLTPGMFVAGLVLFVVLAFVGYIGVQFLRFVEVTPVGLTNPANVFSTIDAELILLEGTSGPGALITIRGSGDQLYNTTANDQGVWSHEVILARGGNDFTVVAKDPATGRDSTELGLTINVPLPDASPSLSPSSAPPAPITISLDEPLSGLVSADGNVVVRGSTTGTRVTIASTYLGAPGSTPGPSPSPVGSPSPAASPTMPPMGPARDSTLNALGVFNESLSFDPGRWLVTITAYASGLEFGLTDGRDNRPVACSDGHPAAHLGREWRFVGAHRGRRRAPARLRRQEAPRGRAALSQRGHRDVRPGRRRGCSAPDPERHRYRLPRGQRRGRQLDLPRRTESRAGRHPVLSSGPSRAG